jgi:hypothetical protein
VAVLLGFGAVCFARFHSLGDREHARQGIEAVLEATGIAEGVLGGEERGLEKVLTLRDMARLYYEAGQSIPAPVTSLGEEGPPVDIGDSLEEALLLTERCGELLDAVLSKVFPSGVDLLWQASLGCLCMESGAGAQDGTKRYARGLRATQHVEQGSATPLAVQEDLLLRVLSKHLQACEPDPNQKGKVGIDSYGDRHIRYLEHKHGMDDNKFKSVSGMDLRA